MNNGLDPRYKLLHRRVTTPKGPGTVLAVLTKIFVALDEPIVKKIGKSEVRCGAWFEGSEVQDQVQ